MQIIEITTPNLGDEFIKVNVHLNKSDPNYIRPLDNDINDVFHPVKNKAFRHGTAARWILKRNGELIGRIAAFANKKYKNKGDDVPVGGIGFFECINDQIAADLLFNTAKDWLKTHGMEAMDGPINFGERDRWWGLLVEGFDPPVYCMNYNPPYYKELFEQYGFLPFFGQICFAMDVQAHVQNKFFVRHDQIAQDKNFRAAHIEKKNLKKYAEDFATVYNKAWAGHGGLKQVNKEVVLKMFQKMKPVMDEKVVWFTYYKDEPIAMWVNMPDLNEWFKYLNGRFDWLGKLKFLWIKATKDCKKFVGLVFGIVPEYQGTGVDAFMIVEGGVNVIQKQTKYQKYEMQWIGDFNPKMINVAESIATHRSRKLVTYRYLFDRSKEFKPHPIVS
jgi:hypothetical protein